MNKYSRKGFTLLELLIVIAILAVLATAVVLVLNPAQYLAQARDTQRMTDMDTLRGAISLYLTEVASPVVAAGPFSTNNAVCGLGAGTCGIRDLYGTTGAGWAAINFELIATGSPLSTLPKDPTNSATYQYAYAGDNTNKTFELNARLESQKFRDKMISDGGDDSTCATFVENTCYYEVGTDPGLNL